jgi:hypothetical protein
MQDFEKLGVFYLGHKVDSDELVLLDSADMVTHSLVIGMTGSGKTGLCLSVLEEAAIDGIPVIAIDPKGDIGNLLLSFKEMTGASFEPWVDAEEARRQGLSAGQFAADEAQKWRTALLESGQDEKRIARMHDSASFDIYTPGGSAGRAISLLHFLKAPSADEIDDTEVFVERLAGAAQSVLSLIGLKALENSREHVLLANIFSVLWKSGKEVDLTALIGLIQNPPFARVGAIDLESFFPEKERFELSYRLNNLIASPSFAAWLEGEPLDIDSMLYTQEGKPRISIFSIAHLSDEERMFFVTLLTNQMVSWMRRQSGTRSLRAIFYMDEIFGYFPPVANPPCKKPLLTMLKQGRAFGLSVMLATQNPVDLDYKGLANAGIWFIGRLQTEQDKERILDGLAAQCGSAGGAQGFDRTSVKQLLSKLGKRVFLMSNIHEDGAVLFRTRPTLSYLRGPLSRQDIRRLYQNKTKGASKSEVVETSVLGNERVPSSPAKAVVTDSDKVMPLLAPGLEQYFIPACVAEFTPARGEWCPFLLTIAELRFTDSKLNLDVLRTKASLTPVADGAPLPVDFSKSRDIKITYDQLLSSPDQTSLRFLPVPKALSAASAMKAFGRDFEEHIYANTRLKLFKDQVSGLVSNLNETERDFRVRLAQVLNEKRDEKLETMRLKYAPKIERLEEKLRLARQKAEAHQADVKRLEMESALSIGATVLGAFVGRKMNALSRANSAARDLNKVSRKRDAAQQAEENLDELLEKLSRLNEEFEKEAQTVDFKPQIVEINIAPKKASIAVKLSALAWVRG